MLADGHDIIADFRAARSSRIGLVPQELTTDAFETVWATVTFSRGLFGKPKNPAYRRAGAARPVALGQARRARSSTLSGGMKRRVMIAKALAHEPRILFLDEPTARCRTSSCAGTCGSWCARLRENGVTIILTTHYIEEAEEMADRVGVISRGEIILVENKARA